MFYRAVKKSLDSIINVLHSIQIILILMSFSVIFYWILQLAGVIFPLPVIFFFDSIKDFIHLFYKRAVTVDDVTLDFSFLVASFLYLSIAWGIKFVIEYIQQLGRKIDSLNKYVRNKQENIFNAELSMITLADAYKNSKVIMLIKFNAHEDESDSFFTKKVTLEQDKTEIEKQALDNFFELLDGDLKCRTKFSNRGLLLFINNIDSVDKIILDIENIVKDLKQIFKEKKWLIESLICVDSYSREGETMRKAEKLEILLNLSLKDKVVCLSTFKERYSLMKRPKHVLQEQGIYKIKDDEEVYILKKL